MQQCSVVCFQECWGCGCLERMGFVSYGNWSNARAVLGAVPFNSVKLLMYGEMCFVKNNILAHPNVFLIIRIFN